jgi:hypothetical protein
MSTVNYHRQDIALNVGDPLMTRVTEPLLLTFINRASRDLINSGWLLPQEHAENIELLADEFEYDVPARFAYIKEVRIGDNIIGDSATIDSGVDLGAAVADTTTTTITVGDSSIFTVNDLIQVDDEIMLVTAVPTSTTLTVTRGYYSTTAATHDNGTDVYRPNADMVFDSIVPRAYWRLKLQTGGANTTTAALGSRPQLVFNAYYFSFTAGRPLQIVGQKRPSTYSAGSDTLDAQMESFIVERATAYAARFLFAQGDHPHLNQVYRESWGVSSHFLSLHPAEFRVRPSSTRVPGR